MSGETEANVSGWTTDTLRAHLLARIEDLREALRQQIDDQHEFTKQQITDLRDASRMATGELRDAVRNQSEDHRRMLDERYATQTKALDAAFKAAEQAVAVALSNAEKATQKAETAADKRFESVNEFRQTLSDQAAAFPTRTEIEVKLDGLKAQDAQQEQRIRELEDRSASWGGARQDSTEKKDYEQRSVNNRIVAVGVIVSVLVIAVNIVIALITHHA